MTKLEVEAFLQIVKNRSITAAARELYVTQPALSRRIRSMEKELGYALFFRGKGIRDVELTEEGKAFIAVAEKFLYLYREAASIAAQGQKKVLKLASISSASNYILPKVLQKFLKEEKYNLEFQHTHSLEGYRYVEDGMADIAIISDDMHAREIHTVPAYKDPFIFVGGEEFEKVSSVHPSMLLPEKEVRLPWNPEYESWHAKWFDASVYPKVHLDQMSMMEEFLVKDYWAIVPLTVTKGMKKRQYHFCPLVDGPPDRIIYYLYKSDEKKEVIQVFLELLHQEITKIEGVQSLLE
jgi:DNA-binding transcriptional LysR family regulator